MLSQWPVIIFISLATSHEVYERIDDLSPNATTLLPVNTKNRTIERPETKSKNTTGAEKPDQENASDAAVWKIYAAFSDGNSKKDDSAPSNNTETKHREDVTKTELNNNGTFKPSPLVEEYHDFDSQEQSSKGGYGYLPPPIKQPPSKFKSATPFEYALPFEHYKKHPKGSQKFPYKYDSPIYLKSKSNWRPGGPTAVESQLPTAIVPAGGYYGIPDAFKEAPVYLEDPEEFRPYGEYGLHGLSHHREIPWGKLLHLMTALVPVSLLISALTPHIITIENVTPEAPAEAPSGIRYPTRNRRSQRQDKSDEQDVISIRSEYLSYPVSTASATRSETSSKAPRSSSASSTSSGVSLLLPQAPNISERCRRRLLCELYSEQHYTKYKKSSDLTTECATYRCEDPQVVTKMISWLLAPRFEQVRDEMAVILQPHQLGFGTPLGCEAAIHAVRLFAIDPHHASDVILKIDLKNAFNSVERDVMLAQVRDKIPSLSPFLEQCYISPSNLFFKGNEIKSQVGAQQGDPLGPLLFSLAIQNTIVSLSSPLNIWYLDDGIIGGAPDVVLRDYKALTAGLESMGLIVNSAKCELYPCGDSGLEQIGPLKDHCPGIKILNKESFELLGAPIFKEGVRVFLEKKRASLATARQNLGLVSSHVALTLFRSCLSIPRLTYTMRTAPTWFYPLEIEQIDNDVRATLEVILNVQLDDSQWMQASLPIRHGGLGVRRMQDTGVSAFLASSHGVVDLVARILCKQGDEISIPYVEEAMNAWSQVCPNAEHPDKPAVQRLWDEQLCKETVSKMLETASVADAARLRAASLPEAGAWLHAIPSPHLGTLLDDGSLRVAVALRLWCWVCDMHQCRCGASVDDRGHHGLSCAMSAGRHSRHHALNDVLRRALISAGLPCTLEPPGLSRTDGKRPDGLTLVPWERGRCLVWDATCVSTFAASHLPRSSRSARSAAEWAAERKHTKYAPLKNTYHFLPFAVEVSGAWCSEALTFVGELGRRLRSNGSDPRAVSYLTQRISLAIQRGNAASIMGTFASGTTRGGLFD